MCVAYPRNREWGEAHLHVQGHLACAKTLVEACVRLKSLLSVRV
jgi:hypothetical protein